MSYQTFMLGLVESVQTEMLAEFADKTGYKLPLIKVDNTNKPLEGQLLLEGVIKCQNVQIVK